LHKTSEKKIHLGVGLIQAHFRGIFVGVISHGRQRHLRWLPCYNWMDDLPSESEKYDGAVISGAKARALLAKMRCPWVQVSAVEPPADGEITVLADNRAIGKVAANHFLERGFHEFAFFGIQDHWYSRERLEGFRERVGTCRVFDSPASKARVFEQWLRGLPQGTALFCANDIYARRALKTLRACGRQVPEEVAVAGVDNDEIENLLSEIPISSVDPRSEVVGAAAAEILEGLMKGKRPRQAVTLIPPGAMVVRQSSDILGIGDPRIAAAMGIIRDRASDRLTVDELAQQMGVSRRTLERRFHEVLGRGIESEMRRVRLQRARQLLSETSLPLREVAEAAGFGDVFYFSTAFRKAENMSPGQWRQQNRNVKETPAPAERRLHAKASRPPPAHKSPIVPFVKANFAPSLHKPRLSA